MPKVKTKPDKKRNKEKKIKEEAEALAKQRQKEIINELKNIRRGKRQSHRAELMKKRMSSTEFIKQPIAK